MGAPANSSKSKGNFVVQVAAGTTTAATSSTIWAIPAWSAVTAAVIAAAAITATAAATATGRIKHRHDAGEPLQNDFCGIFLDTVVTSPFPGLKTALKVDLGALLEVFLSDVSQPFVEDHDTVPLGLLATLARLLVPPLFGRRDA